MNCAICNKDKERLMKIFMKDKATHKSEERHVCAECEGEIERPFIVYVKSSVARSFIRAVKMRGLFVKDTVVRLMKDFAKEE